MIYPMYSVRDVKTTFFPPQIAQNEEDAKRQFAMMINNGDSVLGFLLKTLIFIMLQILIL